MFCDLSHLQSYVYSDSEIPLWEEDPNCAYFCLYLIMHIYGDRPSDCLWIYTVNISLCGCTKV